MPVSHQFVTFEATDKSLLTIIIVSKVIITTLWTIIKKNAGIQSVWNAEMRSITEDRTGSSVVKPARTATTIGRPGAAAIRDFG